MGKHGYLAGKAESIAVMQAERAMSICQISGDLPAIKDTRLSPQRKVRRGGDGNPEYHCVVTVQLLEVDISVRVNFFGRSLLGRRYATAEQIHWQPSWAQTFYNGELVPGLNGVHFDL